jgi:hypothetical protein
MWTTGRHRVKQSISLHEDLLDGGHLQLGTIRPRSLEMAREARHRTSAADVPAADPAVDRAASRGPKG